MTTANGSLTPSHPSPMAETIFQHEDDVTFVLVGILTGLAFLIVVARLLIKIFKTRTVDKSDFLMVISLLISCTYAILVTLSIGQLRGKQPSQITAADALMIVKVVFQSQVLGYLAPLFGRVSFCVYTLSTLTPEAGRKRLVLIVFIVLQLVINILTVILICVRCSNFPALVEYYFLGEHHSCLADDAHDDLEVFTGSFNTLTDVYLTILPSLVVWNLKKMRRNTKIGIAIMFGLSIFACAASAGKTSMVRKLSSHSNQLTRATRFAHFFWVSTTEMNAVILAASIPCLAPLFMGARRPSAARRKDDIALPSFETKVEVAPERMLLLQKATSIFQRCFSFFKGPGAVKDLSDGEIEDLIVARIKGASMRIMVQTEVVVETEDSNGGRMLQDSAAIPLALRESTSGEGFAKTELFGHDKATGLHTTTWEEQELPTLQFAVGIMSSKKSMDSYF